MNLRGEPHVLDEVGDDLLGLGAEHGCERGGRESQGVKRQGGSKSKGRARAWEV